MTIIVDADACPVIPIIERVAKEKGIAVLLVTDTSHILQSDYSEILTVSQDPDAADYALINRARRGDLIVTQDYGVGAMALAKNCLAIHQNGHVYTNETIDQLLFQRHLSKKQRNSKQHRDHSSGHKKRTSIDDERFEKQLRELLK